MNPTASERRTRTLLKRIRELEEKVKRAERIKKALEQLDHTHPALREEQYEDIN